MLYCRVMVTRRSFLAVLSGLPLLGFAKSSGQRQRQEFLRVDELASLTHGQLVIVELKQGEKWLASYQGTTRSALPPNPNVHEFTYVAPHPANTCLSKYHEGGWRIYGYGGTTFLPDSDDPSAVACDLRDQARLRRVDIW